jgi:hypothetical protein
MVDARFDAPVDAKPACTGGDARSTDSTTGHCYMFFSAPKIRNDARTTCAALGANVKLASIESASENQVIATLIGAADSFVGGNDEMIENTFRWEDGTPFVLTNWAMTPSVEPNNGAGMFEEDCIVMRGDGTGKWDDRPCSPPPNVALGMHAYVCERP